MATNGILPKKADFVSERNRESDKEYCELS